MGGSNALTPRAAGAARARKGPRAAAIADQDEELADLQRRFASLEEEQRSMTEKRNTNAAVSLKQSFNMQRSQREGAVATSIKAENDAELRKLDAQISMLRRKHDDLVHSNMEKRHELDKLTDKLHDLTKEAQAPTASDNPIVREIEHLDERLKAAVAKYEDAFEVRRTYEQIVKRLKEERIGSENKLEVREMTLKAKEADYEELLLMSHDANQSKELAKQELAKFEQAVTEERRLREKELAERRALVAKKTEANAELERRERARRESLTTAQHSGTDAPAPGGPPVITEADIAEEQEKIASYEAAFREIKEATGVADVNEVIEKFITQEATHKNQQQLTKESQQKLDALTEKKREAHERVQRLKYSASTEEGQQVAAPGQTERKHERQRHKYERLTKVLVSVKAGIQHLAERLDGVAIDEARLALTDDNMPDVLQQCDKKLRIVIEAIKEEEEAMVREMGEAALKSQPDLPSEPPVSNNFRLGRDADGEEGDSEEEFEEDLEEEVVDRDVLKKQSQTMLDKVTKKTKKRRARGKADE